jgi:hypothetical protein
MGAGDIWKYGEKFVELLNKRSKWKRSSVQY